MWNDDHDSDSYTSVTSDNCRDSVRAERMFKIYSLGSSQVYKRVLLAIVPVPYPGA